MCRIRAYKVVEAFKTYEHSSTEWSYLTSLLLLVNLIRICVHLLLPFALFTLTIIWFRSELCSGSWTYRESFDSDQSFAVVLERITNHLIQIRALQRFLSVLRIIWFRSELCSGSWANHESFDSDQSFAAVLERITNHLIQIRALQRFLSVLRIIWFRSELCSGFLSVLRIIWFRSELCSGSWANRESFDSDQSFAAVLERIANHLIQIRALQRVLERITNHLIQIRAL